MILKVHAVMINGKFKRKKYLKWFMLLESKQV